jgi:TPR repeat protein
MKHSRAALAFGLGLLALPLAVHAPAQAQSADLVLCDRIAADPADPDKPADVQGVTTIAKSDIATAIKFCKTASNASHRALYQLGRAYAANKQIPEALAAYRKAIDKGSTSAMVELGVALGTGNGVAKDTEAARRLFERAAQAGNPRGISNLAAVSGGSVAPADPAQARAQLSKAAEANIAEAQFQLGMMMAEGEGGPKDEAGARALFEKAAAQNHPEALVWAGSFAQRGVGGPEDTARAKEYFSKAAALGNEEAKAALKRIECPYVLKDKRGRVMTNLCF